MLMLAAALMMNRLPTWGFMWAMAFAMFGGCKLLTLATARARGFESVPARVMGYLLVWPGMDAEAFLARRERIPPPAARAWLAAAGRTTLGAVLVWAVVPLALSVHPLLGGWVGMVGLILILHFGTFDLLSLAWRARGVRAVPLMHAPVCSVSVAEFWGRRWNAGFHRLVYAYVFRPTHRALGASAGALLVFFVSGLIHELVITVPARGGYGLPTAYFVLQGAGLLAERSSAGRHLGLGRGWRGRCFTLALTVGPAFWLFPPPFVRNVALPFLLALGAWKGVPS